MARLEGLANDRVYSWRRQMRMLFAYLAGSRASSGHNPKVFLRRVPHSTRLMKRRETSRIYKTITVCSQITRPLDRLLGRSVNFSPAFAPDGKTLTSGSRDGTVKLWEVGTGQELATLKGHTGLVYSVAFAPHGKTLASGSGDGTVKLWEVRIGQELATLMGREYTAYSVAFSPDGKTLASAIDDGTVRLYFAATEEEIARQRSK